MNVLSFPRLRFTIAALGALALLVTVSHAQTIYVSVNTGGTVLQVTSSSTTTLASGLTHPTGLAFGPDGNLYVSQDISGTATSVVSLVTVPGGSVSTKASSFQLPMGLAFNTAGDLFVADYSGSMNIYKVAAGTSTVSTFVSGQNSPFGLAFSSGGNLFVANRDNGRITQITPGGVSSLFAAGLNQPNDLVFDGSGNLFVSNFGNGTISKITSLGAVSTFASGLTSPIGIDFDPITGSLYVGEQATGNIIQISNLGAATGTMSTFASGLGGIQYLAVAPSAVPEPSTYAAIAGTAMLGLAFWRRRRAAASVALSNISAS